MSLSFAIVNLFFILMRNILFILLVSCVVADPFFSSLLYQDVSNQYCTRYYHRTGGVGCRTPLSGLRGIAIPIQEAVSTPLRIPICRAMSRSISRERTRTLCLSCVLPSFPVRSGFWFLTHRERGPGGGRIQDGSGHCRVWKRNFGMLRVWSLPLD